MLLETQVCLGLSRNVAISGSLQQAVDRQKCSFMALTDGLHVLQWALAGNICIILAGLLTGHAAVNRHLTVMKICTDSMWHKCSEEEETAYQLLGRYSAMMMAYYSIFNSELQQTQPHVLLRFVRTLKGLRMGLKLDYSLNAGHYNVLAERKCRAKMMYELPLVVEGQQ